MQSVCFALSANIKVRTLRKRYWMAGAQRVQDMLDLLIGINAILVIVVGVGRGGARGTNGRRRGSLFHLQTLFHRRCTGGR